MRTAVIGGMHISNISEEQEAFLRKREAFAKKYCADKGWTFPPESIEQVLEIRKQEGWKNPI